MKFIFELERTKKRREIINSNDRLHFAVKAKIVANLRALAVYEVHQQWSAMKNGLFDEQRPCGITLTVFAPTKRRLDADNFQPTLKALTDGLVEAGLLEDDNYKILKYTKYQYGGLSGTKKYRLELEIVEIGEHNENY